MREYSDLDVVIATDNTESWLYGDYPAKLGDVIWICPNQNLITWLMISFFTRYGHLRKSLEGNCGLPKCV